jgi:hypothetical protein
MLAGQCAGQCIKELGWEYSLGHYNGCDGGRSNGGLNEIPAVVLGVTNIAEFRPRNKDWRVTNTKKREDREVQSAIINTYRQTRPIADSADFARLHSKHCAMGRFCRRERGGKRGPIAGTGQDKAGEAPE